MGVDTSIKVRVFNTDQSSYKEIKVSDQDNSLGSLFFNNEIKYTSIQFDRQQELTAEENELLNMTESEDYDMMAYSTIIMAKDLLLVVDKIYNKLYRRKSTALENDLNVISSSSISDEEKIKSRKSLISEYFDFESSFSIFRGILKVAAEQDGKIQVIHEFY